MNNPIGRLPPLNALRAFEASARRLSFRAAADELGVTQGAVAQHVRGLEASLGVKLFARLPRTLALTDEGRAYVTHIRRAFELIREATLALRPEPLRLTISITSTFAAKWLLPRLPEFIEANPLIDLRILASESLSNFQSDGVDIAVRQGRLPFGPGLVVDFLFAQEVVAVCSPKLLTNATDALGPAELKNFVLLHDTHNLWPAFMEKALGSTALPETKSLRFNQTGLAIDAAISGQGIALVSRFLVEPDLSAGRLVQPIAATLRGDLDFHVVTPRKPRQPGPTETVRRWLLSMAA
ncbi:MAG: LysR substrate-binding domain-containing protein [Alphaproteobacteria bacterium]|nr:LysR substrate-binding domain-containing protein [Alphaproteobacteria bacterium]